MSEWRQYLADEIRVAARHEDRPFRCRRIDRLCEKLRTLEAADGIKRIACERQRQMDEEGYTPEHDDEHMDGTLSVVAAALAVDGTEARVIDPFGRGNDDDCWGLVRKHGERSCGTPIRALEIAGALIAAEIDRLLRAEETDGGSDEVVD